MSIGVPVDYTLTNLGGGRNEGLAISEIQDNQAADLQNFYTFGTKVKRRMGSTALTGAAYSEALTSLFPLKLSSGTWQLIVGGLTGLAKLDGNALVALPIFDRSTSYNSETTPWHFRQYKNELLAARKNTGTLKRVTEDGMQDAGIAAPSAAPTTADGGAGSIAAGDYQYVVTFVNRNTGAESNPSPASTKLTLGANKKVSISAIPTSLNGQVNGRNIYRTLKDQVGEYFFVAQLADNFTTTYSDNIVQDDLGDAVSFDHGLPPANVEGVEIWRERAWVHDGVDLFHGQPFDGQHFGEFDFIEIYPDDGHKIRGLLAYGDRLVVGKTNAIHYIVRAGERFSLQTLSDAHGLIASHSLQTAEGLIFWLAPDNNVYRSDGVNVHSISTVAVRTTLDAIPASMREKAIGYMDPSRSQYRLAISQGSTTKNEVELVYNYKTDTWSGPFKYPPGAPYYVAGVYDENITKAIYAVFDDAFLYQLNSGTKDGTTAITAIFRSKAFGNDKPQFQKGVRHVSLLCPRLAATVTIRIYNDGSSTPAREVTGLSLDWPEAWKRFKVSTLQRLGQVFQVEVEYSGSPDFDLEGIGIEAMGFVRKGRVH